MERLIVVPPVDTLERRAPRWHSRVPPWLVSMVVHLVVLIAMSLSIHEATRLSKPTGRWAAEGALITKSDEDSYYQSGASGRELNPTTAASLDSETALADALSFRSPPDPTGVLPPTARSMIGTEGLGDGAGPGSSRGTGDGPGVGPGRGIGDGKGRTRVFGLEGEGTRFVYVFDRSASMEGAPLAAVKAELLGSLASLDKMHQFQIVFYNERPSVFNPAGESGKLAFATDQNKVRAKKFVLSMTADGGTRHDEALSTAIGLQPDCIFFLTDGDEPRLSDAQLQRIHRRAGGISINTIEFGKGPASGEPSFLAKLAAQNEGKYLYVDINHLGAGRP